jgi:hypothetical protein
MYASSFYVGNIPFMMVLRISVKQRQNCKLCLETGADYAILVSMPSDSGKHSQISLTCEPITTSEPGTDAAGEVKAVLTSEE